MKTIGVIGRKGGSQGSIYSTDVHRELIKQLTLSLIQHNFSVILDLETCGNFFDAEKIKEINSLKLVRFVDHQAITSEADIVIVLGGDGTMLDAARTFAEHSIPVLGVNQGKLGFITDVTIDECTQVIPKILSKELKIEKRSLLENINTKQTALNDVVLQRNIDSSVIHFSVTIDEKFAYETRADGLIICTPTGSTAYNMSAGGSIFHPASRIFGILPMLPQTLSYRPLLVSDDSTITVKVLNGAGVVTFDGQPVLTVKPFDTFTIKKAEKPALFIHSDQYDYFETLRLKLGWHVEPRFKIQS